MSLLRHLSDTNLQDGNNVRGYQHSSPLTIDTSGQYSPAAILASALINGLQYEASVLAIPISELHHLDDPTEESKEDLNNVDQNQHISIPKPEQFRKLELKLDLTPMLNEDWTMGEDDELYSLPAISPQWFSPDENETGIDWDTYIEDDNHMEDDSFNDSDISESDDGARHFQSEAHKKQVDNIQFCANSSIYHAESNDCNSNNNANQTLNKTSTETPKDNVTPAFNVTLPETVTPEKSVENVIAKNNVMATWNATPTETVTPRDNTNIECKANTRH
ncbi:unnamed protein product [Owenia fusiformis]|uniref:Uncharacterized protein n=1 Tax=Owenia fusiformis TaxID=6347 RepID=A0A8J1TUM1_OWEFU|nr:unnamed protein product [Owenia fusiformis]